MDEKLERLLSIEAVLRAPNGKARNLMKANYLKKYTKTEL